MRSRDGSEPKAEAELAALANAFAPRVDGASVQIDEGFHDRQADAEPPFGARR